MFGFAECVGMSGPRPPGSEAAGAGTDEKRVSPGSCMPARLAWIAAEILEKPGMWGGDRGGQGGLRSAVSGPGEAMGYAEYWLPG